LGQIEGRFSTAIGRPYTPTACACSLLLANAQIYYLKQYASHAIKYS
jgi:hypothetical protein